MKTIARRTLQPDSPLITIQDLVRIKEAMRRAKKKWESHVFFPLVGCTPMTAVVPDNPSMRPHFRFQQSGPAGPRVHGGEGVVHELVKYEVALSRRLRLPIYGKPHSFEFSAMAAEHRVPVRGINYYVDLIGRFAEPAELARDFSNCLVIEICDTHPIKDDKRDDLRAVDLATIEVSLPASLHVRNDVELTGKDIEVKRAEIREFLANIESRHVRMKHHPCYELHLEREIRAERTAAKAETSSTNARSPAASLPLPMPPPVAPPTLTPSAKISPVPQPIHRSTSDSTTQEAVPPADRDDFSLLLRLKRWWDSIWKT